MNRKNFILAAVMLLMPLMTGAQTLKGSYFLDNSLNRNKLNPAFAPQTGYFQIPVIGNTSMGVYSNMTLQDFVYPMNGQLYTYLNKNVSMAQVEAAIPANPYFDMVTEMNMINFGFRGGDKGFWTVDMGLKVSADMDIPRNFFIFMKKGTGTEGQTYNAGSISANAMAALQASVGYSRDMSDVVEGLRIGAKARIILPAAYEGLNMNDVRIAANKDVASINSEGILQSAGLVDVVGPDGSIQPGISENASLAGFGYSFDLGAEYALEFDGFINGVSFSAAVTDLGLIHYGKENGRQYKVNAHAEWTGTDISVNGNVPGNGTAGQTGDIITFKEMEASSFTRSTLPNFYVGAEMPFLNNKMSVGLLYSGRKSYSHMRNELTVSYNAKPVNWFAASINYSFLNVTKTLGWLIELTPKKGPNFFIGSDYFFLELANMPKDSGVETIPTAWRFNLNFGLAIALGGKDR